MSAISYRPFAKVFSRVVAASNSNNAKYADYLCDGTADDVQIQAAIDAVEAAGGGTVFLREGTYTIAAGLTIDTDYVHLVGEGMGATIVKLRDSHNADVRMINLAANYCTARDLTIDGNLSNQTSGDTIGIALDYANAGKSNCEVIRCEAKNTNFTTTAAAGFFAGGCDYFVFDGCHAHNNDDHGFYFDTNASHGVVSNCISYINTSHGFGIYCPSVSLNGCISRANATRGFNTGAARAVFTNCQSLANTAYGFFIQSSSLNCQIVGCSSIANGDGTLPEIGISSSSSGSMVVGCYIEPTDEGIDMAGCDNCVISGNSISGKSLSADNVSKAIYLRSTALRNIITGNRIYLPSGTNNFQYGIREDSAADDRNLVTSNIVNDGQTATISLQGANSVNADNITA